MEAWSETRTCQNCKTDFVIDSEDFSFYQKIGVPAPTFCPDCRRTRRWAWRNNMSLYNRVCELCGKSVISIYAPDAGITVYCNKCWWSDKWDAKSFGRDYDFSRPFFEQYRELLYAVPHMAVVNDDGIASLNCEYTHDWWFAKNCYMCISGWRAENVMYSYYILAGKDIMDSMALMNKNEWIYECFRSSTSYRLKFCQYAKSCIDSAFLYDCANCQDCFMCSGITNKRYYFKNKQYPKEEYDRILAEYRLDTFSGLERAKKEHEAFVLTRPHKYTMTIHNVNCSGDNLSHSKNSQECFAGKGLEHCRYMDYCTFDKDSYDATTTGESSECYECMVGDQSQANRFGLFTVKSQDAEYNQHCHNCQHVFGCAGLRNAKYCIFNTQYSKDEYDALVPKIRAHMSEMPYQAKDGAQYRYGEFFPTEFSPFGYNESYAPELAPLSRDEAFGKGYKWQDHTQKTTGKATLPAESIPESIRDVPDSILEEVLECADCGRNYKIVPNELTFYRKMEIPIPRKCFHCRYADRVAGTNPLKLWHRTCMCGSTGSPEKTMEHFHGAGKCAIEVDTVYAPDRPEIIYCEKCFQVEKY